MLGSAGLRRRSKRCPGRLFSASSKISLGFDEYLRDLQTVIEDGDPINYAAAAADLRPVLVHMFLNDPTVPNEATDAVVELLGSSELGFPGTPEPGPGLNVRVTYVLGGHSSIINPAADAGDPVGSFRAFMELQAEAANFSASGGSYLPIADPGVVLPLP